MNRFLSQRAALAPPALPLPPAAPAPHPTTPFTPHAARAWFCREHGNAEETDAIDRPAQTLATVGSGR